MNSANRILLVDDDAVFCGVLARGFQRRGFDTRECHNGLEAVRACADFRPSHILLDLNMPELSGLAALPQLLAAAPRARLVVLTGYSSIATAVEAIKAGATQYLCKPATVEDILRAFSGEAPEAEARQPTSLDRLEWEHIQRVLNENEGNISATARALGMHRRTLQRKLQKRPVRR
ncbi:response regulator transcription factor [Parahaliea mediterranea]|uniref:Response regulator n=1 Tax=Parahaliea mediterranea TaxID=651086 RepID=A0A939INW5_9GAMM|nr:response regulator [Parahaliea mediterranea]MBN7798543.1 response regulator [Parahaliea mediterranea]